MITALVTLLASLATGGLISTVYLLRANKRKIEAETGKLVADTAFASGSYASDLAQAAAALIAPFNERNGKLEEKVQVLQKLYDEASYENLQLRRALVEEREERHDTQRRFEERLRQAGA